MEWKVVEGGNRVEVTTTFGKVVLSRAEWVDLCREVFGGVPGTGTDDRGVIISTAEQEMEIMKKKFKRTWSSRVRPSR